jgi:hypothetical protein
MITLILVSVDPLCANRVLGQGLLLQTQMRKSLLSAATRF